MNSEFGDRMKAYENVSQNYLMQRTPVIMRIDGKAFHTFTKGLEKPFDQYLSDAMALTTLRLCEEIQGACFGYTQSDEITIVIQDWKKLNTDRWFGYNIQKMTSVSASLATAQFNNVYKHPHGDRIAIFDSRVFNIPEHEVANMLIWRGSDCSRNSVNTLGQAHFSHKELHGKNTSQVQDMLMQKFNINWNDLPVRYKRGICVIPDENGKFKIDLEPPFFTKDRNYIERTFNFKRENDDN